MEGKQEADNDKQDWLFTVTSFTKKFVSEIIDCHSFQACDTEMKQRIKHLLFILNFVEKGDNKQLQTVLQDNKSLLNDIAAGSISWTSELYFKAWQQRVWRRFQKDKLKINLQSNNKLGLNDYNEPPKGKYYKLVEKTAITQEDPLKCQFCPGRFYTRDHLQKHEQNHEKNLENNYEEEREKCQKCGKNVIRKDMHRHLKFVHGPPISCPWCGVISKHLRRHLRRNKCDIPEDQRTKEDTFPCHICSKMIRKTKIKSHVNLVHGNKRFECDKCDYKSYSNHNLYLHVKRVHEQKSLKEICPECNKECVSLDWHIKTYHTSVSHVELI